MAVTDVNRAKIRQPSREKFPFPILPDKMFSVVGIKFMCEIKIVVSLAEKKIRYVSTFAKFLDKIASDFLHHVSTNLYVYMYLNFHFFFALYTMYISL